MIMKRFFFTNAAYLKNFVLPTNPLLPKKAVTEKLSDVSSYNIKILNETFKIYFFCN